MPITKPSQSRTHLFVRIKSEVYFRDGLYICKIGGSRVRVVQASLREEIGLAPMGISWDIDQKGSKTLYVEVAFGERSHIMCRFIVHKIPWGYADSPPEVIRSCKI
jgi:hypothetical protein